MLWSRTAVVLLLPLLLADSNARPRAKRRRKETSSTTTATSLPENSLAMRHHQQGVMAHVQGDVKGAIAAFQRAIDTKPDFAYAYYRLGFVLEEQRSSRRAGRRNEPAAASDRALDAFRSALRIDPSDELAHMSLGQALQDRKRLDEAAAVFVGVTTSVNPASAQAYWALGKARAVGVDEWDSDPEDPLDPSHCYARAHALQPTEFKLDGTRVRRVEPMTPEREAREAAEASARRKRVLEELRDGTRTFNVAGEGDVKLAEGPGRLEL